MAAPVYSERFIALALGSTWHYWACPVGYRAVIACVTAFTGATVGGQAYVTAGGITCWHHVFQVAPSSRIDLLRAVVYEGELIGAYMDSTAARMTVSGYLLRDTVGAMATDQGLTAAEPAAGEDF